MSEPHDEGPERNTAPDAGKVRLQTSTDRADTEAMAVTDARDASIERRLRLGIRLVLYPLCLGLIALAWIHHRGPTSHGPPPPASWVGVTEQDEPVRVVTVDGVLTFLQTRIVTYCPNGVTWVLSLTMSGGAFKQIGDVVSGRQGPSRSLSDEHEPVVIASRMQARFGPRPRGTIRSEVTRNPGPRSVHCSSPELHYTLQHPTDRQPENNGMLHRGTGRPEADPRR